MKKMTVEDYQNTPNTIMLNNYIYDVTQFMNKHPGGKALLLTVIHKDQEYIEKEFNKLNNHSMGALNLLKTLCIGYVEQR